jgi:hypothetical protein
MRYPVAEKYEIICLVEASHLFVTWVLKILGVPKSIFIDDMIAFSSMALKGPVPQ